MSVYEIDPLGDARWSEFVQQHPRASVFHSTGWLDALKRTYGYRPFVLTTSAADEALGNGVALCAIKSVLGNRLVSLPFSDHCEPLVDRPEDADAITSFLAHGIQRRSWRSFELRPRFSVSQLPSGLRPTHQYAFHHCDLALALDEVFARFHASCVRRAIRRAEREGMEYEGGASPRLIESFFGLMQATRRRHGLVPQPIAWFRNLAASLSGAMQIHVASLAGDPVAGIVTLRFRRTLVYKYGASDAQFHRSGGIPFLFWRAIVDAHRKGVEELDLGRSDASHHGLIAFKERLGAQRSTLTYYRQPFRKGREGAWQPRAARWLLERLPDPALTLAGRLLYKHFA